MSAGMVGVYRGFHYQHSSVRVVMPAAETNPLLWIAFTDADRSDVLGWYDTRRAMEADIDELLADGLLQAPTP